jgi:CubicO group peptidase (beta-lactamase class C family)
MADVQGTCDERFAVMRDLLAGNIETGADCGASVAVVVDGELVVDLWGGWVDEARTVPWERDTITNVWSSTKTVMALCTLLLVERGQLDYDAPVAQYWPEFAANGKGDVLVRHLLSHTSGVSGWDQPIEVDDIFDWDVATGKLAAQAPWWPPGEGSGYHALNQGHLVGEVVRRITGKKLGEYLRDELTGPLGIDFHIGLPDSEFGRVSNVIPPPPLPFDLSTIEPDSVLIKTFTGPSPSAEVAWTPEWRRADIGAANGHGNARSIALLQSIVTNGGVAPDGTKYLSDDTIEQVFREQADGIDQVLQLPVRFGIGYALPSDSSPHMPRDRKICYWGGWGGSSIVNVVDRNMTVAYMMNRMAEGLLGDVRGFGLVSAALDAVE